MNSIINKFYVLLDDLILLNVMRREIINEIKEQLPLNDYLKQFCTIRCDIGRQIGKTSYIKLHSDENSLVIVCDLQPVGCFEHSNTNVVTVTQIKNGYLRGKRLYTKIFIDEPSYVFKDISVDVLYKELAAVSSSDTTIIQLGA